MFANRCSIWVVAAVLVLGPSLAPGLAADKGKASVQGKITVFGKPLANGKVWFHPAKGKPVGAVVKNGAYSAAGVPVGDLRVTVEGKGVPRRYSSAEKSPLKVSAQEGNNTYDLFLQ